MTGKEEKIRVSWNTGRSEIWGIDRAVQNIQTYLSSRISREAIRQSLKSGVVIDTPLASFQIKFK